jgi:hypothetical protein
MMKPRKTPHKPNKPQYKIGKANGKQHKPKTQAKLLTTSANPTLRAMSEAIKRRSREGEENTTMETAKLKP